MYARAACAAWARACAAPARGLAQAARRRDHYSALGVSRSATPAELKKAYYALAKEHHPDSAGAGRDASRFAEINAAYEVLSDPAKRRLYDNYGHDGVAAAEAGGGGGGGGGGGRAAGRASAGPTPEEILREFGAFFSGGMPGASGAAPRRAPADAPARGADKQTTATLDFMDAARGVARRVRVAAMRACESCGATGKTPRTTLRACDTCGGDGHVHTAPAGGMFGTVIMPCHACSGAGETLRDPCPECAGLGAVSGVKESRVSFPPGTDTGMVVRVEGAGDDGVRAGPPGDLYIQVRVREDDYFHRDGRDLHVVAPVSIAQAALGGTVKVRTIDGEEEIKVKPGTQSDDTTTLRGRALKSVHGVRRGDQKVHFKVVVPSSLSDRQKELFKELASLDGGNISRPDECGIPGLVQRFQRFLKSTIGVSGR